MNENRTIAEPLVLVVDFLAERGLEVVEAATVDEVLAVIACRPKVKILFTDVNMPGHLNGLNFGA